MEKIIHLLIPRQSNNHRAKILHSSSLLLLASILIVFQAILSFLPHFKPNILGFAAQISPDEVIRLTNQKRAEAGLAALSLNQTLSSAAYLKGKHMLEKDYWSHVAPDGTQPWKFFSDSGYRYRYAGENLARDFSSPASAIAAWMASPTHKENILNPKYAEIGIGVVEGDLAGVDTTIIVQFFGTSYRDNISSAIAKTDTVKPTIESSPAPVVEITPLPEDAYRPLPVQTTEQAVLQVATGPQKVLVSPFTTTRSVSLIVVGLLLCVYAIDAAIVKRKGIARIGGRVLAHSAFLIMVLIIAFIIKAGKII